MSTPIKNIVLNVLGLKAFAKDPEGIEHFTHEQRTALVDQFGDAFVMRFENLEFRSSTATPEQAQQELVALIAEAKTPEIRTLESQLAEARERNSTLQEVVDAMSVEPETAPAAQGIQEAVQSIEKGFKVNMQASHYRGALDFVAGKMTSTPTLDVEAVKSEFGSYLNANRNMDLHQKVFLDFETSKFMTTKIADHEYRASRGLITSVVQQFSPKWTPSGKAKFTPIVIRNRRHKINIALQPNDIVDSWLCHLYDESLSPDKMPITKYIIQYYILPQVLEDVEMRMVAKGKFDETATATLVNGAEGVAPEKGMDGFETILATAHNAVGTDADMGVNFINQTFDYRTCTDDQMLKFTQDFAQSISPFYKKKNLPVFCGPEFYTRYKLAYKNKYGAGSGTEDPRFGSDRIDYSNCILTPLQSMYASPIVFTTPKENFIKLRRTKDTMQLINDIQKVDYDVKIFGEFWLGVGFAIGEAITAFVPEDYNPYTTITACMGDSKAFSKWLGANAAYDKPSTPSQEEGA